jgi:phosphatidate cytidylyltransferase
MGALLAAVALGVLAVDQRLAPWYPFLYLLMLAAAVAGGYELLGLLDPRQRPPALFLLPALAVLVTVNWSRPLAEVWPEAFGLDPWRLVLGAFAALVVLAFLVEMATYTGPGDSVARIALAVWALAYLGLLPSFFVQLRWLDAPTGESVPRGTLALALAVFVPKGCDIGAYFTGRAIGRHPMTPLLSPKKTWEGAAGGLVLAAVIAVGFAALRPHPDSWPVKAVAFGLVVGGLGMLGDLAESLVKRDGQKKDASRAVPGFGGVLDVVDAIVFAAPAAYLWLTTGWLTPLG